MPSVGDLPNLGIESESPAFQADSFTIWATREVPGADILDSGIMGLKDANNLMKQNDKL